MCIYIYIFIIIYIYIFFFVILEFFFQIIFGVGHFGSLSVIFVISGPGDLGLSHWRPESQDKILREKAGENDKDRLNLWKPTCRRTARTIFFMKCWVSQFMGLLRQTHLYGLILHALNSLIKEIKVGLLN